MNIEIIDMANSDTDYTIAYIDGQPAAIVIDADPESVGYYGIIADGEYVHCPADGYRWYVDGGKWASVHTSCPLPDAYTEREINDGNQRILYRDDSAVIFGA